VNRDISKLEKLRKNEWTFLKNLMAYITEHNTDIGFIYKLCLSKFHRGVLPPACILNNLAVKLPDLHYQISSDFNDYEKMLIKKVSSYQVVQTMDFE